MGEQSASRLEGDRYQHLFSWHLILDLLDPEKEIESVRLEYPVAGAADDVTVHPQQGSKQAARYYQIKWHRDQRSGYSMEILMERTKNTTSLLEKFWTSWQELQRTGESELWLVSNWSPQPGNLLGSLIQGRDYRLDEKLLSASLRSIKGQWRHQWQSHLEADDASFARFYRSLRFRLGFAAIADLEEVVDRQMRFYGLQQGKGPRGSAVDQIRKWIEQGGASKIITAARLRTKLDELKLWAPKPEEPSVVVIVHTWARRLYDSQADYELDWSAHFDHLSRRVPDSLTWNEELLPELRRVERTISQQTHCRCIRLRGSLCLSAAFAVGQVFSAAGGYSIEVLHRSEVWRSEAPPDLTYTLTSVEESYDQTASDLLFILSITGDARPHVQDFIKGQQGAFRAGLYLTPAGGPHDYSVQGAARASAIARQTRLELRSALATYKPRVTHLFYFGPRSLAVFIGQKLNACGVIQLYEFHNPGYTPSCTLR